MGHKSNKEALDMCTAATYQTKDFYFGRNLDYEFPYGEEVCIVPRSFRFRCAIFRRCRRTTP